ncbi:MAG: hypothetical protein F4087_08580, partial [Gemmatimonadetes bacterium]|nr:hypothetical protein [Gemmatimonadota bacterium]
MHTGRDVHRDLVRRIRKVRRAADREEEGIQELQRQVAESGERRAATVRALAEFHLPGMNEASVAGTLAEMEGGIRAIYDEKKDRLDVVERSIPEQREVVEGAEAALETVTDALNETGRERARLARVVYQELQGMERWKRLFEQVRKLEARVVASEKRSEAAIREQKEKTPAYERDPFFAYLSRRGHGTGAAAGNALTRRLDRWVAVVTDYEAVRAKYDFLNALPGHAESALEKDRNALAVASPPLERLEAQVIDRNGMTPVLERGDRLYAEREEARKALRDAEGTLRALNDELAALHDERGSYYEEAIDGIEAYLEGRSLDELVVMARETGDLRDDALVAELYEVDERLVHLRDRLAERREERARTASRLRELEDLRDRFEAEDWNGRRSQFDDSLDMNALLLGFMAGRHSSGRLYRTLRRHQQFRPVGDSGLGGSGFRSGGGFGGGGFSTGGGFGGGGG